MQCLQGVFNKFLPSACSSLPPGESPGMEETTTGVRSQGGTDTRNFGTWLRPTHEPRATTEATASGNESLWSVPGRSGMTIGRLGIPACGHSTIIRKPLSAPSHFPPTSTTTNLTINLTMTPPCSPLSPGLPGAGTYCLEPPSRGILVTLLLCENPLAPRPAHILSADPADLIYDSSGYRVSLVVPATTSEGRRKAMNLARLSML